MRKKYHHLKCETKDFQAIEKEFVKCAVQKNNQGFKERDYISLQEVVNGAETGRKIGPVRIEYIFENVDGLYPGYCILCWSNLPNQSEIMVPYPKGGKPVNNSGYQAG